MALQQPEARQVAKPVGQERKLLGVRHRPAHRKACECGTQGRIRIGLARRFRHDNQDDGREVAGRQNQRPLAHWHAREVLAGDHQESARTAERHVFAAFRLDAAGL